MRSRAGVTRGGYDDINLGTSLTYQQIVAEVEGRATVLGKTLDQILLWSMVWSVRLGQRELQCLK